MSDDLTALAFFDNAVDCNIKSRTNTALNKPGADDSCQQIHTDSAMSDLELDNFV